MSHVVTCFLRDPDAERLLLTRRSDAVGSYAGRWAGVSGSVEGDPADAVDDALREIREETGLSAVTEGADAGDADATHGDADATHDDADATHGDGRDAPLARLVRAGDPLDVVDGDREWTVHPFLFDVTGRDLTPNEELAATEWVQPTAMCDRETVPGLWAAYRRVGPTVETVRTDGEHGSSWLALRALAALRDAAVDADSFDEVAEAARSLRDARPSMAVVANRLNRVLAEAERTPEAVRRRAERAVDEAVAADEEAAAALASLLDDVGRIATLSRSETVRRALAATDCTVVIGESRPAREGVAVAESLAADRDVTLTTDAALPGRAFDAAVVGADAVLPDGSVVNKVGTYPLALAAAERGVPCYVVTARDKVRVDETVHEEPGEEAALYGGDAPLAVSNPTFERVPAGRVTLVTEAGVLDADEVARVAADHRANAEWDDPADDDGDGGAADDDGEGDPADDDRDGDAGPGDGDVERTEG